MYQSQTSLKDHIYHILTTPEIYLSSKLPTTVFNLLIANTYIPTLTPPPQHLPQLDCTLMY